MMTVEEQTAQANARVLVDSFHERFQEQYGEDQLLMACHAAFPMAVTPDMLYQLWINFRDYPDEKTEQMRAIDRIAVSDVLLWHCWQEVDAEVYELDIAVRAYLLDKLRKDVRFGEERLRQLARFLHQYTERIIKDQLGAPFREIQKWTAMATLAPAEATKELARQLTASVESTNELEVLRLRNVLEGLTGQQERFRGMLYISKALKSHYLGYDAGTVSRQIELAKGQWGYGLTEDILPNEPFLSIPIPTNAPNEAELPAKPTSRVYILAVGIDKYKNVQLNGCANDARLLVETLADYSPYPVVYKGLLIDEQATKANILTEFGKLLLQAEANDIVVFTFSGHGQNGRDLVAQNTMITYGLVSQVFSATDDTATTITETEFRDLVHTYGKREPYVILITDTHHGSPKWLNRTNPKHIILTAGSNWDFVRITQSKSETQSQDKPESQGIFTAALVNALRSTGGPQTYFNLIREIHQALQQDGRSQTPQLFGTEDALRRPFLSTDDSGILYLQELGRAYGTYAGAMSGLANENMSALGKLPTDTPWKPKLLEQTGFDKWNRAYVRQLTNFYERYACVQPIKNQFTFLVLTDNQDLNARHIIEQTLTFLPFDYSITVESEPDRFYEVIQSSQAIILLLLKPICDHKDFKHWADQLVHYCRFERKVLIPVLLEPCDWQNSSLRYVNVYPANGQPLNTPIFNTPNIDPNTDQWIQTLQEIYDNQLKPFYSFYHETPLAAPRRGIGRVQTTHLTLNESGFLIAKDILLTAAYLFTTPESAKTATVTFTDAGGLSSSFRLQPDEFFRRDTETGLCLVNVDEQPYQSDYQDGKSLNYYFNLKIAQHSPKPDSLLYLTDYTSSQNLSNNFYTVVSADEERVHVQTDTSRATINGALLNEENEIVAFITEPKLANVPLLYRSIEEVINRDTLKPSVLLVFASSKTNYLPSLDTEYYGVFDALRDRIKQSDFTVVSLRDATHARFYAEISALEKDICLFMFSGHATSTSILLEQEVVYSDELASLLSRCPNLKVVILNGDSTKQQAELLLENKIPIVIAANRRVTDREASQFSIGLFEALAKYRLPISEAFDKAIGATQYDNQIPQVSTDRSEIPYFIDLDFSVERTSPKDISEERASSLDISEERASPWGLHYYIENKSIVDSWCLPTKQLSNVEKHLYAKMPQSVWRHNGKNILVVGTRNYHLTDLEFKAADSIGRMLATKQYGLTGGGHSGIDHVTGRAYSNELATYIMSDKDFFVQIVYRDQKPDFQGGTTLFVNNEPEWYTEAMLHSNAVIMIAGGERTYQTYITARQKSIPVIPLATMGGGAERAYSEMRQDFIEQYGPTTELSRLYESLNDTSLTGEQIAQIVASMLTIMLLDPPSPKMTTVPA